MEKMQIIDVSRSGIGFPASRFSHYKWMGNVTKSYAIVPSQQVEECVFSLHSIISIEFMCYLHMIGDTEAYKYCGFDFTVSETTETFLESEFFNNLSDKNKELVQKYLNKVNKYRNKLAAASIEKKNARSAHGDAEVLTMDSTVINKLDTIIEKCKRMLNKYGSALIELTDSKSEKLFKGDIVKLHETEYWTPDVDVAFYNNSNPFYDNNTTEIGSENNIGEDEDEENEDETKSLEKTA